MVLECSRRSEGSHDRVSRELFDRSTRPLNLVGHRLVKAVETSSNALGVLVPGERRRADEVGEENRDELPLLPNAHGAKSRRAMGLALELGEPPGSPRPPPLVRFADKTLRVFPQTPSTGPLRGQDAPRLLENRGQRLLPDVEPFVELRVGGRERAEHPDAVAVDTRFQEDEPAAKSLVDDALG